MLCILSLASLVPCPAFSTPSSLVTLSLLTGSPEVNPQLSMFQTQPVTSGSEFPPNIRGEYNRRTPALSPSAEKREAELAGRIEPLRPESKKSNGARSFSRLKNFDLIRRRRTKENQTNARFLVKNSSFQNPPNPANPVKNALKSQLKICVNL